MVSYAVHFILVLPCLVLACYAGTCLSASDALFLPLLTTELVRPSNNKLPFRHNVSLTVTLTAGTPPQPVTMVLDTGSELSWLHCKKTPTTPSVFNPLQSKSFSSIPCSSPVCTTRTRDFPIPVSCDAKKLCRAVVSYADSSSLEGTLAAETFRFGQSVFPKTVFGCMDSGQSTNPDEDSKTTGLLGLNLGSLSFVSQTGFTKFSYCISGRDSSGVLLFGEVKLGWLKPLRYTPLVRRNTRLPYFDRVAYTVQLEGIRVGKTPLSLPRSVFVPDHTGAGQTMVDSGTRFTYLLGPVYSALRAEFMRQTKGILRVYENPEFVFEGAMDLCFRVPPSFSAARLPAVTLVFQGAEMSVTGERLLYRVVGSRGSGRDAIHCFTFGNSDLLGVESYIIGHHHQQNVWVEFDLRGSRVGFADVQCDVASQRLGLPG
uniref:Peptidase A1 domain-containing protein n=1 Tax=Kalanchoe fedtschenkoi TaxID=63787 RepID=A0A7N0ZVM4_KALFE